MNEKKKEEMSCKMSHVPINKEEFKEANIELAAMFKTVYYATSIFDKYTSQTACDEVVAVLRNLRLKFMPKYRLSSREIPSITEEYTNKEERIVLAKVNILWDMIDRYKAVFMGEVNIKYINPNIEARLCRLIMTDKTGYVRAKNQVIELSQKFMLHETKLRMNFWTREKLFIMEDDKLFPPFKATYRKTVEYLECIRPDMIKVTNIMWRIF